MKNDLGSLVRRFYDELWNSRDLSVIEQLTESGVTFRGSLGGARVGRGELVRYVEDVTTSLGNYRCDLHQLVVDGPTAAARLTFGGRHVGPFLGYEPTGRHVSWSGAAFFTMGSVAIQDIWVLGDLHSLVTQLQAE